MIKSLELLAPAKNLECGIAAIDHGADAVYIGAQRFGARASAGNSIEDIARLCNYAHQYQAKVYVTVNTIIFDDELEATRELLSELQQIGVDAVLVQDLSILSFHSPLFFQFFPSSPCFYTNRQPHGSQSAMVIRYRFQSRCFSPRVVY